MGSTGWRVSAHMPFTPTAWMLRRSTTGAGPSAMGPPTAHPDTNTSPAMTTSQPFDLRLPTPGCYNDPERAGLDAKSVFDGMTEHLFFTLGKLAPTASRHDLYMALSYAVRIS